MKGFVNCYLLQSNRMKKFINNLYLYIYENYPKKFTLVYNSIGKYLSLILYSNQRIIQNYNNNY